MDAESVKFLAVGLTGSIGLLGPALGLGTDRLCHRYSPGTQSRGKRSHSDQHDPGGRSYRSRRHLCPDRVDHSWHGGIAVEMGLEGGTMGNESLPIPLVIFVLMVLITFDGVRWRDSHNSPVDWRPTLLLPKDCDSGVAHWPRSLEEEVKCSE